ncbi:MAG: twin-arginine translocase subunit TatC [Gemmatimonadota bacterium]|jgi:sec-independent protein translocase protein TatC|nr:MAG: twin-arginine translocase subunit TatC [Gemmatimonadota bacterium]
MTRDRAEMPFLDHLEELRWRIIWSLVAIMAGSIIGFLLVVQLDVIGVLERPIQDLLPDRKLVFTSPTTPFFVSLKLGVAVGLVLALPVIIYQAWAFLSPALHEGERRYVVPGAVGGVVLFIAGVGMAYFLALPVGLRFLLTFQAESLAPIITIDEYLKFATGVILAFGVLFQLPVVLVVLGLLGVVTPASLAKYRRHAIVILAILSALLTPADPGTMLMLLIPLALLYELSIWLTRVAIRRKAAGAEEGAPLPAR